MNTQLTVPKTLELHITAAEYDDLENWLPLKLAELEVTKEHQQRLAWWQEHGIRGIAFIKNGHYSHEDIDLTLNFRVGLTDKKERDSRKRAEATNSSSLFPRFSALPIQKALAKLNKHLNSSPNASSELRHLEIMDPPNERLNSTADLKELSKCFPMLKTLHLRNLPIEKDSLIHLVNLTQLTELFLQNNSIDEKGTVALAKPLANLTQLTSLNLSDNYVGEQGAVELAKPLGHLTQLTNLNLSDNYIGEQGAVELAKPLSYLPKLTSLNLSNNNIRERGAMALAKPLANLTRLTQLNLNGNEIGEQGAIALARSQSKLTQLRILEIGGNNIGEQGAVALAQLLANLTQQLMFLQLKNNNINDKALKVIASTLIKLPKLKHLSLSENPITNLTPLLPLMKREMEVYLKHAYRGIDLIDCPIATPPPEIVEQGREAILNYFEEREAQDTVKLREAKLLIVGEPGVGKTSLVRRLTQSKHGLPAESETTKGIDIEALNVTTNDGKTLKLNLWDFGGQEIYHSTHQFFLTKRSLYVLVDSSRTNDNGLNTGIHDERYCYWLDVVASLSERSPLLLFQNQVAGRSKYIDVGSIKGEYPNVQCSDEGDLKKYNAVNSLRKNIIHHAEQLPHIDDDIPTQWLAIREALATLANEKQGNRAYITLSEYLALYRRFINKDQAAPDDERKKALLLSNYFHDLGIFLHFQNEPALAKTVILQNTWATEAVFKVLDDEEIKGKNGHFNLSDCKRIWKQAEYQDMHIELLALLEKFEICYKLPSANNNRHQAEWLTPQLLQEQPEFLRSLQQKLQSPTREFPVMRLHYQYQFLPRGIVSRLMVRMHHHVNEPAKSWNKGVLFELHKADYSKGHNIENSSLLVQLTNKTNEIALTAFGPEAKTLQGIIAAALDELNNTFEGLKDKVEKLVPCICNECEISGSPFFHEAKTLHKFRQKGRANTVCNLSAEDVPVTELLEGLPMEEQRDGKEMLSEFSDALRKEVYRGEKPLAFSNKELAQEEETIADQNKSSRSSSGLQTITLFLASSQELKAERDAFHVFLAEQNDRLIKQGVYIELIRWEHFFDAVAEHGLQNEYNEKVRSIYLIQK